MAAPAPRSNLTTKTRRASLSLPLPPCSLTLQYVFAGLDRKGIHANDSQYPALSGYLKKYPLAASGLFQAYNDITYGGSRSLAGILQAEHVSAQQWADVTVVDLGDEYQRAAIRGRRKMGPEDGGGISEDFSYVFPCSLTEQFPIERSGMKFFLLDT